MSTTTETAADHAAEVVDAAREQAGRVTEQGRGMLRGQVDARSTQAGQQAQSMAQTLRQTAGQLREGGDRQQAEYARFAEKGAERLENVGRYLTESDADELLAKLEDGARRQPWLVAGFGLLLGIGAARFLKASSGERYHRATPDRRWDAYATRQPQPLSDPGPSITSGPAV